MIECPNCKHQNSLVVEKCVVCGTFLGYPNVNDAQRPEELAALTQRYDKTVGKITEDIDIKKIQDFENAINTEAKAVVNIDLDYLENFIVSQVKRIKKSDLNIKLRTLPDELANFLSRCSRFSYKSA